jgi:hypothetical protein
MLINVGCLKKIKKSRSSGYLFSAVAIDLLLLGMFMMATMKKICTNEWGESVPFTSSQSSNNHSQTR